MEEAEAALEQEENKVVRAQMDLAQTKQEIERRLQEKEEEFENTRKNFARALDSMQASLDGEIKAKEEALRIKKKIEGNNNTQRARKFKKVQAKKKLVKSNKSIFFSREIAFMAVSNFFPLHKLIFSHF